MRNEPQRVIEEIIHILSNVDCLHNYENAGELTYYLDMGQGQDKPKIRLMKVVDQNNQYAEPFTLDNEYKFQFGYVMTQTSPEGGTTQEYGGLYQNTNVGSLWDLLVIIHDPNVPFDVVNNAVPAFNKVGLELINIESNPVNVVLRNGMMSTKDFRSYPPMLRAYAYTFKIPFYPTSKATLF